MLVFFTNNYPRAGPLYGPAAQATVPGELHTANGEVLPKPYGHCMVVGHFGWLGKNVSEGRENIGSSSEFPTNSSLAFANTVCFIGSASIFCTN